LIDVGEPRCRADADLAGIRGFGAREHAEQRGLAGPVRTDDAHDTAARQVEGELVYQQALAVALAQAGNADHQVAETLTRRNVDLVGLVALLDLARRELFVALQSRLALRLPRLGILPYPLELVRERLAKRLALTLLECQPLFLLLEPRGVIAVPGNAV